MTRSEYYTYIDRIMPRLAQGETQAAVGKRYGVTRQTIIKWVKQYNAEHNKVKIEVTPERTVVELKQDMIEFSELDIELNANAIRAYVVSGVKTVIEAQIREGIDPHPGYYKILQDTAKQLDILNPPKKETSIELDFDEIPTFVKPNMGEYETNTDNEQVMTVIQDGVEITISESDLEE